MRDYMTNVGNRLAKAATQLRVHNHGGNASKSFVGAVRFLVAVPCGQNTRMAQGH